MTVENCKDEDDLVSAFKMMTRKKILKIHTTRNIYVRKSVPNLTQEIKEMLKRVGKNIYELDLKLAVEFDEA